MRRPFGSVLVLAMVLGAAPHVRGEVRAVTDSSGNYKMTRVLARTAAAVTRTPGVVPRKVEVWRPVGRGAGVYTLNPKGDLLLDLWPTVAEPRQQPHHAWVFWSRDAGPDYDLVFSRWAGQGWTEVQGLHPALAGNDLDARVAFDQDSRPYVVWWNDDAGVGRVFFSMYLQSRWMDPLLVSDEGVDSRRPQVELDEGSITVVFTAEGSGERRVVRFYRPVSITDDINPLGFDPGNEQDEGYNGVRIYVPIWKP